MRNIPEYERLQTSGPRRCGRVGKGEIQNNNDKENVSSVQEFKQRLRTRQRERKRIKEIFPFGKNVNGFYLHWLIDSFCKNRTEPRARVPARTHMYRGERSVSRRHRIRNLRLDDVKTRCQFRHDPCACAPWPHSACRED